ncbi:MAG: hypothetical protein A3I68_08235 [Candidatus Melainabacteria bacterium RIFCSPLOWO2_02_FULL_35_15]|nr:MAG: hypothetical protein A3F80_08460 [Candidatus Melainabacteria bacterium RIFCSPLOWO2_12_FULL_35_11]OGI13964.1 MAG: hypothetical protein A3I68_08235 [Candidatus Melainabacteria bacterium RIFCSPLOWO2_02_FULL_35_15]
MSLSKIGIVDNPLAFREARNCFLHGVTALRKAVGKTDLEDDATLTILRASRKDLEDITPDDEKEARFYSRTINRLVEPWRTLLTYRHRDELNSELSRFSEGSYSEPQYEPECENKIDYLIWLLQNQVDEEIKKTKERTDLNLATKKKKEDPTETPLEINFNNCEAFKNLAQKRESSELHRLESNAQRLSILTIFSNADIGYIFSVLSSNAMGAKHKNETVRLGTLNIVGGFLISALRRLNTDLDELSSSAFLATKDKKEEIKKGLIQDTIEILDSTNAILTIPNFSTNDPNIAVRKKAISLKADVSNASGILRKFVA